MSEPSTRTEQSAPPQQDTVEPAESSPPATAPVEDVATSASPEAAEPLTDAAQQAATAGEDAAQQAEQEGERGTEPDAEQDTEDDEDSRVARLEREGEVAADFLEQLLDIADLDGDLDVDVDGDRAAVAIIDSEEGRVPRRLVGDEGKVLEALQELTRLAVQAETGERSRLMLDVAGYRADRRKTLVETARAAVAEVKSSGERKMLEPMTAFERKVVHDEVLAGGLSSESEGVEPERCVVILPG